MRKALLLQLLQFLYQTSSGDTFMASLCASVCPATHLIGPIRGNNFLKICARRSKFLPKIGEKYCSRSMDYFCCKVVPGQS